MKHTTRLFPTSILIGIFILSACAQATTPSPKPVIDASATPTFQLNATFVPTHTSVQPEATATPTDVPPQPIATSRGPNLEATDPTTVSLASEQLQLVEFFRFT